MDHDPKLDPETAAIIQNADEITNMLSSKGWSLVKAKLDARILDLQNISNIDTTKPEKLEAQIFGRLLAVEEMFAWLKVDVYGEAERADRVKPDVAAESDSFIDDGGSK